MKCPYCRHDDTKVLESRPNAEEPAIRRRRECTSCGRRFTTYERFIEAPLMVIKRDGTRELYDPNKIMRGISIACQKTDVTPHAIEEVVQEITEDLENNPDREISTNEIGEIVLKRLQRLSEVAYIRFASVYRQFNSIEDFIQELNHLKGVKV